MPYILIQVTRDGLTQARKDALISGATDLVVRMLGKDPTRTFVVIDEVDTDNWGVGGASLSSQRPAQTTDHEQVPAAIGGPA